MIAAGIDIGSVTAKAAIVSKDRILGTHVIPTGYNPEPAGVGLFAVAKAQPPDLHSW